MISKKRWDELFKKYNLTAKDMPAFFPTSLKKKNKVEELIIMIGEAKKLREKLLKVSKKNGKRTTKRAGK